jgi:hypothetical protein
MANIEHYVCPNVTKPLELYNHATVWNGLVFVSGYFPPFFFFFFVLIAIFHFSFRVNTHGIGVVRETHGNTLI